MANWQTELTSCGETLVNVNNRRGIFQGDSSSSLLFVIIMILLTHVPLKVIVYVGKKIGLKACGSKNKKE